MNWHSRSTAVTGVLLWFALVKALDSTFCLWLKCGKVCSGTYFLFVTLQNKCCMITCEMVKFVVRYLVYSHKICRLANGRREIFSPSNTANSAISFDIRRHLYNVTLASAVENDSSKSDILLQLLNMMVSHKRISQQWQRKNKVKKIVKAFYTTKANTMTTFLLLQNLNLKKFKLKIVKKIFPKQRQTQIATFLFLSHNSRTVVSIWRRKSSNIKKQLHLTTSHHFAASLFIARQHTDAWYWYSNSVCPSVSPSIRPTLY